MSTNQNTPGHPAPEPVPIRLIEKHKIIYAKRARGLFDNWRVGMVFLTQAIFYGGLWLEWNDRQALLFHLVERKFYIFGRSVA